MEPDTIDIIVEELADGVVVRPQGIIYHTNAVGFGAELNLIQADSPSRLVIDFADVPEIDSAAIAILIEAMRRAIQTSSLMILCNLSARVQSLLEIVGLDRTVFTIAVDLNEAAQLPHRRESERFVPGEIEADLGEIRDLSATGVRLRTLRRVDGPVKVTLDGHGFSVSVPSHVAWNRLSGDGGFDYGLRFDALDDDTAHTLVRLITAAGKTSFKTRQ